MSLLAEVAADGNRNPEDSRCHIRTHGLFLIRPIPSTRTAMENPAGLGTSKTGGKSARMDEARNASADSDAIMGGQSPARCHACVAAGRIGKAGKSAAKRMYGKAGGLGLTRPGAVKRGCGTRQSERGRKMANFKGFVRLVVVCWAKMGDFRGGPAVETSRAFRLAKYCM